MSLVIEKESKKVSFTHPVMVHIDVAADPVETASQIREHGFKLLQFANRLDPAYLNKDLDKVLREFRREKEIAEEIHEIDISKMKKEIRAKEEKIEIPEVSGLSGDEVAEVEEVNPKEFDFGDEPESIPAKRAEKELAKSKPQAKAKAAQAPVEPAPVKEVKLTLEGHIIPAFRAYSLKHSRNEAGKILAGFGLQSVRELKPEQFPAVMKALAL